MQYDMSMVNDNIAIYHNCNFHHQCQRFPILLLEHQLLRVSQPLSDEYGWWRPRMEERPAGVK